MRFFKRFLKRSEPIDEAQRQLKDLLESRNQIVQTAYDAYAGMKTALFKALVSSIATQIGESDRADRIAAYASNLMTGESHDPEKLARLNKVDRSMADALSKESLESGELRRFAAEADWWLAQAIVTEAFDMETQRLPGDALRYAVSHLSRAIDLVGDDARYYATLANTFQSALMAEEAYDAASKSLQLEGNNPEAYRLKGNAAFLLGKLEEAEYCFDRALTLAPGDKMLLGVRALVREARRESL